MVRVNNVWQWQWAWRIASRGRGADDLDAFLDLIGSTTALVDKFDGWSWELSRNKKFTVRGLSKIIDDTLLSSYSPGNNFVWNSSIFKKVNIFMWRASINRIPTFQNLANRWCKFDTMFVM